MNWGYRIALFFTCFVIFMLTMVYKCVQQDFDLVSENYYAQEIAYQDRIDRLANTEQLDTKPTYKIGEQHLNIGFPSAIESGNIYCFRPSDETLDFEHVLALSKQHQYQIPLTEFTSGIYKLKVEWIQNNTNYYQEQEIFIP
jgi:hypothetical protein